MCLAVDVERVVVLGLDGGAVVEHGGRLPRVLCRHKALRVPRESECQRERSDRRHEHHREDD